MLDAVINQSAGRCYFFFNISKRVGINQPNDPIDLLLVQFGYACMAKNPRNTAPPELKAIYGAVIPGSLYTGKPEEPLSVAILAQQKRDHLPLDGHISRMQMSTSVYSGTSGAEQFLIARLCNNIRDLQPNTYPRIDLNSTTPSALAAAARYMFSI